MNSDLSPIQSVILGFVRDHPVALKRSEIAKVLVGSQSVRTADFQETDYFGRLSQFKRKTILQDVDILIEQGFLLIDRDKVVSLVSLEAS